MTRSEVVGALESSFHAPPEDFCKLMYDTCADGVLKAFNSQRPAIGAYAVAPSIYRMTPISASVYETGSRPPGHCRGYVNRIFGVLFTVRAPALWHIISADIKNDVAE
jgi:hypothetical protein